MVADLKDDRDARDAYTVEQATKIFSLAPWVGCASATDRLTVGARLFHDSLYFVLLLVWYTGIRNNEAGRVKNVSSVRLVALCDEFLRLGFVHYVEAIKAAGHLAVFPELVAERDGTKKGDVSTASGHRRRAIRLRC